MPKGRNRTNSAATATVPPPGRRINNHPALQFAYKLVLNQWLLGPMSFIDEIDCALARHYGFTEEELDFLINYDIKYRMGREVEETEEK